MKMTVEFKNDSGETLIATFDEASQTVTTDAGHTATYARDAAANTLTPKGDLNSVVTFDGPFAVDIGASGRYSTTDGHQGVATLISMS